MTSLKRHIIKKTNLMKLHNIFLEDIKLMSNKVLKVWYRYLEPFSVTASIREGRG